MALGWKCNGFTPAKRAACLRALARGVTVAEACREARISPTTFYRHEKKDPDFASLCRAARAQSGGEASLETLAWERGVTGIEEEIVQGGKVVGRRVRRSDGVFKMLLEMGGDGRASKALRARIERELRPKIEAELREEAAAVRGQGRDAKVIFDELSARLAEIRREEEEKKAARQRSGG
ncbi:MAG TPA: helix-turn-helix domain-containing protein [Allosphingosinicella sp.]|jgi:AcrR family transcriptional regulator